MNRYIIPRAVEFAVVSVASTVTALSSMNVTHTLELPSCSLMKRLNAANWGTVGQI